MTVRVVAALLWFSATSMLTAMAMFAVSGPAWVAPLFGAAVACALIVDPGGRLFGHRLPGSAGQSQS